MELEKKMEILRILRVFNPWWETGRIDNVEPFERLDLSALKNKLEDNEIITIVGARQVGKTTMMEQVVKHLLLHEDPRRILFVIADNTGLNAVSKNLIEDSILVHQEFVLKEELNRSSRRIFVLIDEVQKIENWAQTIKSWYDINKKIKFLISGSSSTKIISESTKPFVGRAVNQMVVPFKFFECVRYDNFRKGDLNWSLNKMKTDLIKKFMEIACKKDAGKEDIDSIFSGFREIHKNLAIDENKIKGLLNEYMVKGGYPGIVKEPDMKKCAELLTTNYKDVINSDIKNVYSIRKPQLMESLLTIMSRNTGQILNLVDICNDLGEGMALIREYIGFLMDAFILSVSENYLYSRSTTVRKKIKKFYVNDTGMRNVVNNSFSDIVMQDGNELGRLVETIVFNHCLRLKFKMTGKHKPEMFYWRKDDEEIDIMLDCGAHAIPIEVKYRNNIDKKDIRPICDYVESGKAPFGFVITIDKLEMDGKIIFVPLWLFLLMV